MIKILRLLVRLMLFLIAVPCGLCMGFVWLFIWTPVVLTGALVLFLCDFAKGEECAVRPLEPILWFFWLYVLFDIKKSERYL